jgi:hypothetical protein
LHGLAGWKCDNELKGLGFTPGKEGKNNVTELDGQIKHFVD